MDARRTERLLRAGGLGVTEELFDQLVVGPLECNCYLVGDVASRKTLVVDPGGDADAILSRIDRLGLAVDGIVATHAHFDHIVAAQHLRDATGAPFLLHSGDLGWLPLMQESARLWMGLELGPAPSVDRVLSERDVLDVGGVELAVVHTPGHSEGSISLLTEHRLFSGDALFAGSVGRTDLPGGSEEVLRRTIREKIFGLDEEVEVLPGHGPATTVGRERRSNPYVGHGGLWTG